MAGFRLGPAPEMRVDRTVLLPLSFPGLQSAHQTSFLDEGNTDISKLISETTVMAVKALAELTFDSLTDGRPHIAMRGCRYTAPPLTSTGSGVC